MASPLAFLPEELIIEIISLLPVEDLLQLKYVNKFFKTLISNPNFVQIHLKKSSRNSHLALVWQDEFKQNNVTTFPVSRLIENSYITTIQYDPYNPLDKYDSSRYIVGSCNGLLCFIKFNESILLYLWNPATRTMSRRLLSVLYRRFKFSFGYDNSNDTYKVVAFRVDNGNGISEVRILSLGDDIDSRNIQSFPAIPLYWFRNDKNNSVYLNGTINWLALRDYFDSHYNFDGNINVEQYVIVSLDLSTESYTQLLLPQGFDEVPRFQPTIVVLMDRLCFSHDFKGTHFVIWQMKDFGVQESWTRLFKISYLDFYLSDHHCSLNVQQLEFSLLYISKNGDKLILAENEMDLAFIYNCKDHGVERIKIYTKTRWSMAMDYVESLVPTY